MLKASAAGLESGRHAAILEVRPTVTGKETASPDASVATLPVEIRVRPAVVVVPARVFFGVVPPGTHAERTVAFLFAEEVLVPREAGVSVRHSLGDLLSVTWTKSSGRNWELNVRLAAPQHVPPDPLIEGVVEVTFAEGPGKADTFRMPVTAYVERADR